MDTCPKFGHFPVKLKCLYLHQKITIMNRIFWICFSFRTVLLLFVACLEHLQTLCLKLGHATLVFIELCSGETRCWRPSKRSSVNTQVRLFFFVFFYVFLLYTISHLLVEIGTWFQIYIDFLVLIQGFRYILIFSF